MNFSRGQMHLRKAYDSLSKSTYFCLMLEFLGNLILRSRSPSMN